MALDPYVLVTGDFVRTGGMDAANYALASFLNRNGHAVTLVAHRVAPDLASMHGITVHLVNRPLGSNFLGQRALSGTGSRIARSASMAGARVVVNGGNCAYPDINWVHYVHAAYKPFSGVSTAARLKTLVTRQVNLRNERRALSVARVVLCNSNITRRHVIDLCGVNPARAVTVYYGTDPDRFRPADPAERAAIRRHLQWTYDVPIVLFVGALGDRRKGFDTVFEAWRLLRQKSHWHAQLVVVGAGAEKKLWEARASEAGLSEFVRFLGFRNDVPDLLRASDALVAPSRYEAYGLNVQEAICCGLPAIISGKSGIAERYPADLSALLLPDPNDAADLAGRLLEWRLDMPKWAERIKPLMCTLRQHTWDSMSRRIVEICN